MDSENNTIKISKNILNTTDGELRTYQIRVNKDLIGVGKDYIVIDMTEDDLLQLGKLAMDMASSDIKELTLKI